jgi:hypothetical protein
MHGPLNVNKVEIRLVKDFLSVIMFLLVVIALAEDGFDLLNSGELGTAVAQWLRYCATNRKVAGSIPDGVSGIFH